MEEVSESQYLGEATLPDIRITIFEAVKHNEVAPPYVMFGIRTESSGTLFSSPVAEVRRRYSDFVWLHKILSEQHPACILPPLPDKHRKEYVTGDRFSTEFIEKRKISLQFFLERICRHPILHHSNTFIKFLEVDEPISAADRRSSGVFENISDAWINTFSKVSKPDVQFESLKKELDLLKDGMNAVEKNHSKLLKIQQELQEDLSELSTCINSFSMLETQMTEPLGLVASAMNDISSLMLQKNNHEDAEFVINIKDYVAYYHQVREILKNRDQKQAEFEELSKYLDQHIQERERTTSGKSSSSVTEFLNNKISEMKGVDLDAAREYKVQKLSGKINDLQTAVDSSNKECDLFSKHVKKEIEWFKRVREQDFKQFLTEYSRAQENFHSKAFNVWEQLETRLMQ